TKKHNQEVADYRAGKSGSAEFPEDSGELVEAAPATPRRTVSGPDAPGVGSTWRPDRR
ncbi:MAG TPA: hypothetical protein GXZ33_09270, partial [Corynebacterium sp.]|nr:hypothetical protein [Corynebacterium sp.]